ncbi:hypothetical protein M433DRAFT_160435 [Acidomyces richmondensis BFW]|nr:hypothetical protein M433DRAFT_160435 [Acidomyces richmondensis BFW]
MSVCLSVCVSVCLCSLCNCVCVCVGKLSYRGRCATTASACRHNPTRLRSIPTTLAGLTERAIRLSSRSLPPSPTSSSKTNTLLIAFLILTSPVL